MNTQNNIVRSFAALAVLLVVAGCSSVPDDYVTQKALEDAAKQENQERLDAMPDWVTEEPVTTLSKVSVVASGTNEDPVEAAMEARMKARFEIARNLFGVLTGQARMEKHDSGFANTEDSQVLIDEFVNSVELVGYSTENQEVVADARGFIAYVQMELSGAGLQETIRRNKTEVKETFGIDEDAFADLMQRVQASRGKAR